MSTAAVSSTSINQQIHQFFHTRQNDLQQLGQALSAGDLAGARAAYSNIVTLGKNGPFAGGNSFKLTPREQDFNAVGQALQAGDLAAAKQAFGALKATFQGSGHQLDPPPLPAASPSPASGPEIILNLSSLNSSSASPEQITINISNPAGGGEQVSIGIGTQGSTAEQVTLNLPANSNEQIVLNLLGASSTTAGSSTSTSTTTSGSSASGGLSISA